MGQEPASVKLFSAHRVALVNYANGIVGDLGHAEDLVQEAWVRFDDAERRRLINEPLSYLYRIVRNLAFDRLGRTRREGRIIVRENETAIGEVAAEQPSPEQAALSRDEYRRLAAALGDLPENMRVAIEMHRFAGAKLREIAEELDISLPAAHRLVVEGIARCRAKLR